MFGLFGMSTSEKARRIYEAARSRARKVCGAGGTVTRIPSDCFFLSAKDAEACTVISLAHAFRGSRCIPWAYHRDGLKHIEAANEVMLEVVRLAYEDYGVKLVDHAWNSCALATRDESVQASARQMFGQLTQESWSFVHLTYTVNWLFFAINGFENCYLQNEMSEMAQRLLAEWKGFVADLSIDF